MQRAIGEDFCRAAVDAFNQDPDAAAAARGWKGAFGLVIHRGTSSLHVHVGAPQEGKLPPPRFCTAAELAALAPEYFAAADEATWRELVEGTLDPVGAVVARRLTLRGDLEPVVARLGYRGLAERWVQRLKET
jgi:hypothetical protein